MSKYIETGKLLTWLNNYNLPDDASWQICRSDMLREVNCLPAAEVIPISFIEEWFKTHYRTSAPALVLEWKESQNKK